MILNKFSYAFLYSSIPGAACQMDNFMNANNSNMTEKWAIDILINEGLSQLSEDKVKEFYELKIDDINFYQKLYWIDGALRNEN